MSKVRADNYTDRTGASNPTFPYGAIVTGVCSATDFSGTGLSPADFPNGITGVAATFTGNVTVGGTLTYEDVTNVDSTGIVTAKGGVVVPVDGVASKFGAGGDLEIYHSSDVNIIKSTNASAPIRLQAPSAEVMANFTPNGSCELYQDNSKKFETTTTGTVTTGIATATSFSGPGNIPGNVTTGTYTIVASDAGKLVSATGTVTLPAATFEVGDAISVYNNTASNMTLTCSAPTAVYLGSDGSTKTSLTLALRCICTFVCVDTASNDTFVATGGGLS